MRLNAVTDLSCDGEIAVVTIDNPPVNALSAEVRDGIYEALRQAIKDDAVQAIVLMCAGRTFVAGGDIASLGSRQSGAPMREIAALIEASPKPVVTAIHGAALGGGFELSLAAHWRIATPSARVGLPEVKLGILPGAGGTQRLPRLVGAEKALEMIVFGEPIGAREAFEVGAIDGLVEADDMRAGAIDFARRVAAESRPLKRARDAASTADPTVFDNFAVRHAARFEGALAPAACLKSIRAAFELPFEAGLDFERELTDALIPSLQSKALRHIFFAERDIFKIPGAPRPSELAPISKVAVLAATRDGLADARAFAQGAVELVVFDLDAARLADAEVPAGAVKSADPAALGDCDLVMDPTFGPEAAQRALLAEVAPHLRPDAIVGSMALAGAADLVAAERLVGLHFFYPGDERKFVELVRTDATAPSEVARVGQLLKRMGKLPVVVKPDPLGVASRAMRARQAAAEAALLEGAATAAEIDEALRGFGFAEGVFQWEDRIGLDVPWIRTGAPGDALRERLCALGRKGRTEGRGFYDYAADGSALPSSEVEAVIADLASETNASKRCSGEALTLRLIAPIAGEAAKLVEEGLVIRPSDADLMWVAGFGWPDYRGGPLFWAEHEAHLGGCADA
jgi:3-hydroxyacyl-CoA dehydrogenase